MKSLKISVVSFLLHHANRLGKDAEFYDTIKNRILKQYGTHLCYDVQFIEGKECFSCDGTGIYEEVADGFTIDDEDAILQIACHNCYDGWYKRPTWNILAKIQFGMYTFHQPYKRVYSKPDITIPLIEGYISHTPSRFAPLAKFILFAIYNWRGFKLRYGFDFKKLKYRFQYFKDRWRRQTAAVDNLPF